MSKATWWGIIRLVLHYSVKRSEFTSSDEFKLAHEYPFSLQGSWKSLWKQRLYFPESKDQEKGSRDYIYWLDSHPWVRQSSEFDSVWWGFTTFFPPHEMIHFLPSLLFIIIFFLFIYLKQSLGLDCLNLVVFWNLAMWAIYKQWIDQNWDYSNLQRQKERGISIYIISPYALFLHWRSPFHNIFFSSQSPRW